MHLWEALRAMVENNDQLVNNSANTKLRIHENQLEYFYSPNCRWQRCTSDINYYLDQQYSLVVELGHDWNWAYEQMKGGAVVRRLSWKDPEQSIFLSLAAEHILWTLSNYEVYLTLSFLDATDWVLAL